MNSYDNYDDSGASLSNAGLDATVAYIDDEGNVVIVGYEAYRKTSWIDGDGRAIPAGWKSVVVVPNSKIKGAPKESPLE